MYVNPSGLIPRKSIDTDKKVEYVHIQRRSHVERKFLVLPMLCVSTVQPSMDNFKCMLVHSESNLGVEIAHLPTLSA